MLCWHSLSPVKKGLNSETHLEAYQIGHLCPARVRSERSPPVQPAEQVAGCLDAHGSGVDGMMRLS